MKIVWSAQGRDGLLEIYRRIACDNVNAARALHDKIISRINLLSESPQIGCAGRVAGTRELVIAGTAYVVPYRVSGGVVQILRVYHTSRLWPDSFK